VKFIIDYKNWSQQNVKGAHKVFRKQTFEPSSPTKGSRKNNFTFLHLSFSPSLADSSLAKSAK